MFKITCYWAGEDEYGDIISKPCDGEHRAQKGHTIAVDPSVIPYGSIVSINGQEYTAEDCGGAVKGNVIDIWVEHKSNSFGVKHAEVYIKENRKE